MAYQTVKVRKLTPTHGAEVFGLDLGERLTSRQFDDVHQALMENLVIFFRDQKLTAQQHKDLDARFGKLDLHRNAAREVDGHPEIDQGRRNLQAGRGREWQSDVSCDPEPPMGSTLYVHEAPIEGLSPQMVTRG